MIKKFVPDYLCKLLPGTVAEKTEYNMRNKSNRGLIKCRLQSKYNSFLPKTTREWNSLSQDLKSSVSTDSFKASD